MKAPTKAFVEGVEAGAAGEVVSAVVEGISWLMTSSTGLHSWSRKEEGSDQSCLDRLGGEPESFKAFISVSLDMIRKIYLFDVDEEVIERDDVRREEE